MRRLSMTLSFLLIAACEEPTKRGPPADPSITDTGDVSSSSSSAAVHDDPCAAFSGCMDACAGADCPARCASATDSDEMFCTDARCDALRDACGDGDTQACADVLACADASETSTDSSTDGGSSSST